MIRLENFIQLKAFARQDALLLTLLWTVSFLCIMTAQAGALGNLLALATPFFVGWRTGKFRDSVLGGTISYRRAFAYGVYNYIYAAMLFALVQFAYFRFLDHGTFAQTLTEAMKIVTPVYEQSGMTKEQINDSISLVSALTPIQWAFIFMMQNIAIGVVTSLPMAALCTRRASAAR